MTLARQERDSRLRDRAAVGLTQWSWSGEEELEVGELFAA